MKIIFDGNEVRDLFEAYRYYVDPDSPVDFNDIVETINSCNKHFNELLYYTCLLMISFHRHQSIKKDLKRTAFTLIKNMNDDDGDEPLDILDIEFVPNSFDIIVTLPTSTNVTLPKTSEFSDS